MNAKKQPDEFDYQDYSKKMRLALSDKHIATPEGNINHKYFLIKKGQYWTEEMQASLIQVITKEGVGMWANALKSDLNTSSEIELELRTCLTLSISDISKYKGKKYTVDQINQESAYNIKRGKENDKLKYGIYMV